MKILLIQEQGRHEKNRNFRECENFKRSFQKLNIDVSVWGLNYDNFSVPFNDIVKDKDVIISLENYNTGWVPDISNYKNKLKIFWSIDSHCKLLSQLKTVFLNKFDIVLNSIDHHQKFFKFFSKTFYFPNAYPDDLIYPKNEIEKKYEIGFCGSLISDREVWLDFLASKFSLKKDIFVIGNDMVNAINSYKINFNKTLADDINYRVFETMGCKTALVTNKPRGIEEMFTDGKEIIYYSSRDELEEKVKFYSNNQAELRAISERGYNIVKSRHTYLERAKFLLQIINEY